VSVVADELADLEAAIAQWSAEIDLESALGDLGDLVDGHSWVSLAEAEQRAGVSRSTLRAWFRSGQIPSRLMPGPHGMQRLVPVDLVVERANRADRPATTNRPPAPAATTEPKDVSMAPPSDVVRLAELAVNEARERAAAAEARADRLESALHAALERAATAEARLAGQGL
jgi:hypothetical protein